MRHWAWPPRPPRALPSVLSADAQLDATRIADACIHRATFCTAPPIHRPFATGPSAAHTRCAVAQSDGDDAFEFAWERIRRRCQRSQRRLDTHVLAVEPARSSAFPREEATSPTTILMDTEMKLAGRTTAGALSQRVYGKLSACAQRHHCGRRGAGLPTVTSGLGAELHDTWASVRTRRCHPPLATGTVYEGERAARVHARHLHHRSVQRTPAPSPTHSGVVSPPPRAQPRRRARGHSRHRCP